MYLKRPIIDITSLNAVESVFRDDSGGDPWGYELAGKLADVYAYADQMRFVLPYPRDRAAGIDATVIPSIVHRIQQHDHAAFVGADYHLGDKIVLDAARLDESLNAFLAWAGGNRRALRRWLQVHAESWISGRDSIRMPDRYVYDIDVVQAHPTLKAEATQLDIYPSELCYAFDIALRYGLYGEIVGASSFYLSHPIREQPEIPTREICAKDEPPIAISFAPSVQALAKNLDLDGYVSLLGELRNVVQSEQLYRLKPGAIERDEIRRIAAQLGLPARLKGWAKATGLASPFIGAFAAVPEAGVAEAATIASSVVAIGAIFLSGDVPARVSQARWLRWAFKWELESQAHN